MTSRAVSAARTQLISSAAAGDSVMAAGKAHQREGQFWSRRYEARALNTASNRVTLLSAATIAKICN